MGVWRCDWHPILWNRLRRQSGIKNTGRLLLDRDSFHFVPTHSISSVKGGEKLFPSLRTTHDFTAIMVVSPPQSVNDGKGMALRSFNPGSILRIAERRSSTKTRPPNTAP